MSHGIDSAAAIRMVGGRKRTPKGINREHLKGDDFYSTPAVAVEALLKEEQFIGPIWEPACGVGAISEVLKRSGHEVISTDLAERGYGEGRIDFLMEHKGRAPNIITNPPYKNAVAFARNAIALTSGKVAFLLRLAWLEGVTRRRLFDSTPLARVWVFSRRLPRMHREGYTGKRTSSSIAFAWFVWENGYRGRPVLGFLDAQADRGATHGTKGTGDTPEAKKPGSLFDKDGRPDPNGTALA